MEYYSAIMKNEIMKFVGIWMELEKIISSKAKFACSLSLKTSNSTSSDMKTVACHNCRNKRLKGTIVGVGGWGSSRKTSSRVHVILSGKHEQ